MPNVEECVCCHEIDEIVTKKGDHNCIIGHPGFEEGCLNLYALEIAYYAYRQDHGNYRMNERLPHKRHRYTAYRQLVRWCWGYLGKEIRVPLPACAVNRIREEFPSFDYKGFEEPALD